MKYLFPFALMVASLAVSPATAQLSDLICDDSARLAKQLGGRFGAEKKGRGMRGPDALIEVWIDSRSGDWTLVQSYANGTSCIVAMGEDWEMLAPPEDPA